MIKNRVFRVMFHFISACAALFIILLSIVVGYFFSVVAPRNQAAQQQAALFLTLKGPARRVAIFDAGGVTLTSIQRKTGRFLIVAEVAVEDIEMLDGSHLEGKGVRPDVEVYPAPEDVRSGKDAALEAAIHALGF